MRFLQSLVTDVEKRIRRGHQRLALNSQQSTVTVSCFFFHFHFLEDLKFILCMYIFKDLKIFWGRKMSLLYYQEIFLHDHKAFPCVLILN